MKTNSMLQVFLLAMIMCLPVVNLTQARVHLKKEAEISLQHQPEVSEWMVLNEETTIGIARNAILAIHRGRLESFPTVEGLVVKTALAPNRKYLVVMRMFPLPPTDRRPRRVWITIYNAQLQEQGRLPLTIAYDAPFPELAINNNGQVMVVHRETAQYRLYTSAGKKLKEGKLFDHADYDLERIIHVAAIGKSNEFLIAATRHGMTVNRKMEPEVLKFDGRGTVLWQKQIKADAIGQLAISPQGGFFALATYGFKGQQIIKRSTIFNTEGEEQVHTEVLFKTATFSSDEALVFLADNEEVVVVNLESKKVLWHKPLVAPGAMITAATFDPDKQRIFVLVANNRFENGQFQFVNPRLVIIKRDGEVIGEQTFPNKAFLKPALYFDPKEKILHIGFRNSIQKLKVVQ